MESTRYACSLDDRELTHRRKEWRSLEERALIRAESRFDGRLLVYRGGERTAGSLTALIEAERRCCPWLSFDVHTENDEVHVSVRFPTEARSSAVDLGIAPSSAAEEMPRTSEDPRAATGGDVADQEEPDLAEIAKRAMSCRPALDAIGERIALTVAQRLIEGEPIEIADVATDVRLTAERVEATVSDWSGCVFRDEAGRIVGFSGISLPDFPSPHRLLVDGRDLVAWCAWDMLLLPSLLNTEAEAVSLCPVTGELISVMVSPRGIEGSSHPDAVVSFLTAEGGIGTDVIQGFCRFVHLFASREAGERWRADRPDTFLLSLERGFELGRRVNELTFPHTMGASG